MVQVLDVVRELLLGAADGDGTNAACTLLALELLRELLGQARRRATFLFSIRAGTLGEDL